MLPLPDDHVTADRESRANGGKAGYTRVGGYRPNQIETSTELSARLEWLDDLMFSAIEGDPTALQAAAGAWKKIVADLGADAVEESRRQYLRRAQSVWNALRHQPNHPPHKVFAAIEVISLLAGKAW